MNKKIAKIPINKIKNIRIYENKKNNKKSLSQIKKETGADYIINGGLYNNRTFNPVIHLKSNGKVTARDKYTYWGYAWNDAKDFNMEVIPNDKDNYIACVELIRDGKKKEHLRYSRDVGGKRGRTALCTDDDSIYLYCTKDGTNDAKTPEQIQDELFELGVKSAIMLDGGGSSQCDMNGDVVYSSRRVANYILVYLKESEKQPKKHTVCLDAGHDKTCVNGSPDGAYKEYEFAWDICQRMKALLEHSGINVVNTRDSVTEKKQLTDRARVSNNAKADLFVSAHSNAVGDGGWNSARGFEVWTSQRGATAGRNIVSNKIIEQMRDSGVRLRPTPLRHYRYTVLAKTIAPACLIEYGFHTNGDDAKLLSDDSYRDKIAVATVKGICEYFSVEYRGKEKEVEEIKTTTETENTDVADWAKVAWDKAKVKGILDGTRPSDGMTRQEMAVVLDRLGLLDEEGTIKYERKVC